MIIQNIKIKPINNVDIVYNNSNPMKRTKIDRLLYYMSIDDKENSIKLVSTFNRGVTKNELEIIKIASECYKGNENFYRSLGYNIDEYKAKAWDAIVTNYGLQLNDWLNKK